MAQTQAKPESEATEPVTFEEYLIEYIAAIVRKGGKAKHVAADVYNMLRKNGLLKSSPVEASLRLPLLHQQYRLDAGISRSAMAQQMGVGEAALRKQEAILSLPVSIQMAVQLGKLSPSDVFELVVFHDAEIQTELAAARASLSAGEWRALVRRRRHKIRQFVACDEPNSEG